MAASRPGRRRTSRRGSPSSTSRTRSPSTGTRTAPRATTAARTSTERVRSARRLEAVDRAHREEVRGVVADAVAQEHVERGRYDAAAVHVRGRHERVEAVHAVVAERELLE